MVTPGDRAHDTPRQREGRGRCRPRGDEACRAVNISRFVMPRIASSDAGMLRRLLSASARPLGDGAVRMHVLRAEMTLDSQPPKEATTMSA